MQQWAHGGLEHVISRQGVTSLEQARRQTSRRGSRSSSRITDLRWRQNARPLEGILDLGLQGPQQEIGIGWVTAVTCTSAFSKTRAPFFKGDRASMA